MKITTKTSDTGREVLINDNPASAFRTKEILTTMVGELTEEDAAEVLVYVASILPHFVIISEETIDEVDILTISDEN